LLQNNKPKKGNATRRFQFVLVWLVVEIPHERCLFEETVQLVTCNAPEWLVAGHSFLHSCFCVMKLFQKIVVGGSLPNSAQIVSVIVF